MNRDDKDRLHPTLSLLVKLASIVGHVDEAMSLNGNVEDWSVLEILLKDEEVRRWLREMGPFVPVKR